MDFLTRRPSTMTDCDSPRDPLHKVTPVRAWSQDDIERVLVLLDRAPADRAWRRRGWHVMLRYYQRSYRSWRRAPFIPDIEVRELVKLKPQRVFRAVVEFL